MAENQKNEPPKIVVGRRKEVTDYLKIEQCREGYLYRIIARNGRFGIYHERKQESSFCHDFILSRHKFGENYTFSEHHWDDGEPYGTAKPVKEIEQVPDAVINGSEEEKLAYLNRFEGAFIGDAYERSSDS